MDKLIENRLRSIHDDIYKRIEQSYIDIFLCGGRSINKTLSIRDKVRKNLKQKNIRFLYPEDLFMEILSKDKDSDLLSLENFLANNCDIICIICESAGSLVELGAFTNNDKLRNKIIAVVDESKKKNDSFIMLGPIKLLRKNNLNSVIYYSKENIEKLTEKLNKHFKNELKNRKQNEGKQLNTFIGLYYFITLLLYFFKSLKEEEVILYLEYLFGHLNFSTEKLNTLMHLALKLLYKDRYIQKDVVNRICTYKLTDKGYDFITDILKNINTNDKTKLYDYIRFDIMKNKYYHCSS